MWEGDTTQQTPGVCRIPMSGTKMESSSVAWRKGVPVSAQNYQGIGLVVSIIVTYSSQQLGQSTFVFFLTFLDPVKTWASSS